jgi:hypothetical protein
MHAAEQFEEFLIERLSLSPEDRLRRCEWAGAGNTIGALALRLGALDLAEIDRILDAQEDDRRLFGELAVHLGMLSEEQVKRLVELQRFHQLFEVGEQYVVQGRIGIRDLLVAILEFPSSSSSRTTPAAAL